MDAAADLPGEPLEWPSLTPAERYRRATWEGLLIIQRTDEYVWLTSGEHAWQAFSDATRPGWAGPIGRKLVADHPADFTRDIAGALKLMAAYGAEVWGSGERRATHIRKLDEFRGHLTITNHGCPQWRAFSSEMRGKFPCNRACGREVDSVVKQGLGAEFTVETIEGRPMGHDNCVWEVRMQSSRDK